MHDLHAISKWATSDIELLTTEIVKRFHIPPKRAEIPINKGIQGGGTFSEVPPRSHLGSPTLFYLFGATSTIVDRWSLGGTFVKVPPIANVLQIGI